MAIPGNPLFRFLESLNVGFEGRCVFVLSFQFGLELLDKHFETADFISELLKFDWRSGWYSRCWNWCGCPWRCGRRRRDCDWSL